MLYALPWLIMPLWLIGGQIEKGVRRYGVPGITMTAFLWRLFTMYGKGKTTRKYRYKFLVFILFVPVLTLGYGVNSWLKMILRRDWLVRLAYALLLAIPLWIYSALAGSMVKALIATVALIGAFQVRAGKLTTIGTFDLLYEDIVRSLTLGYAIVGVAV